MSCRGVIKRFGSLTANDRVDFDVRGGEVHALVGENGAGKSTLMSIFYGLLRPDEGTVQLHGRDVVFRSCADAMQAGIGMVFQHYLLVERFSVAENVMLGKERSQAGFLDRSAAIRSVNEMAERYRFALDAAALVETLGVGARQQVELLKVLERDPKIVILDEPTAALSPAEIEGLFEVIRRIRDEGRAVIFITHKLKEVMAISDRISVLRRGRMAGRMARSQATETRIASLMVGGNGGLLSDTSSSAAASAPPSGGRAKSTVLQVAGLTVLGDNGSAAVNDVRLTARAGEIVGVAGVEGNGQLEFAEALYGIRSAAQGSIEYNGVNVTAWPSLRRRAAGVRYIPFDRQREGLVLDFDAVENTVLGDQRKLSRGSVMDMTTARERADSIAAEYDVRGYVRSRPVRSYSGGTQQKLLIGRELHARPQLIFACAPTRGVDIGASNFIYERLGAMRAAGACILLISYDLDEIRALSDRIIVFYRGRIAGERPAGDADDATLGRLMGGAAST